MINEVLEKFGFDEKEIKVYLGSLELGAVPASEISRKTGLQRELVYVVLSRLEKKGIAGSTIKNYKKYYTVIEPTELINQLEEKKFLLKKILPKLNELKNKETIPKPTTETFSGVEGIKTVLNHILDYYAKNPKEKLLLGYGSAGKFEELLKWSFPHFIEERKKAKIRFKAIYNKTKEGKKKKNLPLSEIRLLPEEVESPVFHLIYPNHVATIIFNEEPLGIVVKSSEIFKNYTVYFNQLWKTAK
ncbi:hypothetical protein GOV13_04250 [Candidatus Pacearchaeota archaeon]|nr:hypothetical protein [Candidatus Pacearchaeota archaeon]